MKLFEPTEKKTQINLTSLIDILFLLIIFFSVSTQFKGNNHLSLQLPKATSQEKPINFQQRLVIFIDKNSQLFIDNNLITWENIEEILQKNNYDKTQNVILNIDEQVSHGIVIRLIDQLKKNEFQKISFGIRTTF